MRVSMLVVLLVAVVGGCGSLPVDSESIDTSLILTHQSDMVDLENAIAYCSGEHYSVVCRMAYEYGLSLLPAEVSRPATVVMDLDMTLVQGHQFNGWLLEKGLSYSAGRQYAYLTCNNLPPVPGALAFVKEVQTRGYTVVFVTNRKPLLRKATRKNLVHLGLGDITVLYRTAERSKLGRIASLSNVVMSVGDKDGDHPLEEVPHVFLPNPLY